MSLESIATTSYKTWSFRILALNGFLVPRNDKRDRPPVCHPEHNEGSI